MHIKQNIEYSISRNFNHYTKMHLMSKDAKEKLPGTNLGQCNNKQK